MYQCLNYNNNYCDTLRLPMMFNLEVVLHNLIFFSMSYVIKHYLQFAGLAGIQPCVCILG